LDYIHPGKPTENGFIESFNAAVRRECLSQHYSPNIVDARCVLSTWRDEYNNTRPHSALGQLSPVQYRSQVEATGDRKKLALRRA
jgi:putative transposase